MTAESQELFEKVKAILDKHYEKDKDAYFPYLDESALEISEILYADKIAFAKHTKTAELKTAMDFVKAYDQDRGAFLEDMEAACIAFAKHHCEEQAKAIEEKLKSTGGVWVGEDSIRNAYDLSNIK